MKYYALLLLLIVNLFAHADMPKLTFAIAEKNYILLIDSSSSMKQFDPKDLRQSAVRLFSILLPEDSFAGVSQFSSSVETLLPLQKVTPKIRQQIADKSSAIHNFGVMTDLNGALLESAKALSRKNGDKHIILITDGFIESGISAEKTKHMKKQLSQEVLPKLQESKIHVHIISSADAGNKPILNTLIHKTNGIYHEVKYSDQLTKKLVNIFDRTNYQAYQLNASKMNFDVRNKVKEVSIIINDADAMVVLVDPEGHEYKHSTVPSYIEWKKDYGYQAVTIKLPIAGRWYLKSNRELDNRVVIFDDFKLEVSDVPHHLFLREHLLLNVALLMNGEIVRHPQLLKYLKFSVADKVKGNEQKIFHLSSNKENGIYQGNIILNKQGQHELTITVKSPAFSRSVTKNIHVYAAPVKTEVHRDFDKRIHELTVTPYSKLLVPEKTVVEAIISQGIKPREIKKLKYDVKKNKWSLSLKELPAGEAYAIHFRVDGVDEVGRPFHVLTDPTLIYSTLAQNIDFKSVSPAKLPQHLPLIYRFDLVTQDYISKLAYPEVDMPQEQKVQKESNDAAKKAKKMAKTEIIEFKDPTGATTLGIMTMFFFIILLFLYIRHKHSARKLNLILSYHLLTDENSLEGNT